jgi:hypothetical protein
VGSIGKRLDAVEGHVEQLIVRAMAEAEIQGMLTALEASEAIEPNLYDKVVRIVDQWKAKRWRA